MMTIASAEAVCRYCPPPARQAKANRGSKRNAFAGEARLQVTVGESADFLDHALPKLVNRLAITFGIPES
jgi:hypothetical protein